MLHTAITKCSAVTAEKLQMTSLPPNPIFQDHTGTFGLEFACTIQSWTEAWKKERAHGYDVGYSTNSVGSWGKRDLP